MRQLRYRIPGRWEPPAEAAFEGPTLLGSGWPFLGSVKVQVSVRVGGTEASVGELVELKQGAVLALDRLVDEPLDVLIDGWSLLLRAIAGVYS